MFKLWRHRLFLFRRHRLGRHDGHPPGCQIRSHFAVLDPRLHQEVIRIFGNGKLFDDFSDRRKKHSNENDSASHCSRQFVIAANKVKNFFLIWIFILKFWSQLHMFYVCWSLIVLICFYWEDWNSNLRRFTFLLGG